MRTRADDVGLAAARLVFVQILQPGEKTVILIGSEGTRSGKDHQHRQVQHIAIPVHGHIGPDIYRARDRRRRERLTDPPMRAARWLRERYRAFDRLAIPNGSAGFDLSPDCDPPWTAFFDHSYQRARMADCHGMSVDRQYKIVPLRRRHH